MHLNHGGISGGKDSTALMLWMVYESGYPKESLRFTFCDTDNEAEETYHHVQMLSEKVFPIEVLKPERGFYELARHKKRFPSAKARFCTQELKMVPTLAWCNANREEHTILMHSGVRASESDDRAKLSEYEVWYESFFLLPERRPLLRWSIEDVWAIHAKYGVPRNPLYDEGAMRVGCFPCVLSRKREVANIAIRKPERMAKIASEERRVTAPVPYRSFFARDKVPDRYRSVTIQTSDKPVRRSGILVSAQAALDMDGFDDFKDVIPGQTVRVASINDVVKWALNEPDLYTEAFEWYEESPACDTRWGACE